MVSPLLYDFRRTITSKSVLITVAVIILISAALIHFVRSASSPVPQLGAGTSEVLEYESGTAYHFFGFSFNVYGQPVSGATYSAVIMASTGRHSVNATTNSGGEVTFQLPQSPGQNQLSLGITYQSSFSGSSFSETMPPSAPGQAVSLTGNEFVPVIDSVNASRIDLLVTYEGVNGSSPANYNVYYGFNSTAVVGFAIPRTAPSEAGMSLLGQLGSFHKVFMMPSPSTGSQSVELAIFLPNATAVDWVQYPLSDFEATSVKVRASFVFASFTAAILVVIVPLMAVLVAYGSYAKDRVSGVLESVLSRPVSRRGLSVSRYLSIVLALASAIGTTILVMVALADTLIGSVAGWTTFAGYTFISLVVEAAAFVGLVMLLSHLLKSTGALIGLAITLWVFLEFLWGVVLLGVDTALGYGANSASALGVVLHSYLLNPSQYYLLVRDYVNNLAINTSGGTTVPISPAAYGLTPIVLGIDGILWVVLPFALFYYRATRRD
ncbi:MAG: ABC transporter permease subunit [Nitrososphaerota archaeon]|nr:ABC transporter permease subunit [Nitrososphaerota archaeon]